MKRPTFINDENVKLEGEIALARFDFNVPLLEGKIQDTTRLDEAVPTIQYLLDQGVKKLVLISHLGRPKGKITPELSLAPIGEYLAHKFQTSVVLSENYGEGFNELLKLNEARIYLLENIRFFPEEENNDADFAKELSRIGTLFVNDAFGAMHRKHASTYSICSSFPKKRYAGLLIKKELEGLEKVVHFPKRPFVAIVGGAKVKDKIKVLESLLPEVDHLLVAGAMAYPFLKAKGRDIGNSLCSDEDVRLAKILLGPKSAKKIFLPRDHVVARSLEGDGKKTVQGSIPDNFYGLDIGPETLSHYRTLIEKAETVFWNGPMGLFENPMFAKGTNEVARIIAGSSCFSCVGGGDSVRAIKALGLEKSFGHVSTGGGAGLDYISGSGSLPGLEALKFGPMD